MEPVYKGNCIADTCLSFAFKPVKEKKINDLFSNRSTEELFFFKDRLERNNRRFSAEKIAEVCSKVISSTQPVVGGEDACFKIEYNISELMYFKDDFDTYECVIDPDNFIKIFKDATNIELKVSEDKTLVEGIVNQNAFLLQSKLNFKAPPLKVDLLSSHFEKLLIEKKFVDVKLAVENTMIDAHKAVLSQCPFFEKLFLGEWKDSKEIPTIPFENYSYDAVNALVYFLYHHEAMPRVQESIPFYLEMLKLADFVDYSPLKPILIEKIFNCVNKNNFIHLATADAEFEDPSLARLFQRCLAKYSNNKEIDFTPWSFLSLLMLTLKAKEYGVSGELYQDALKEVSKRIELNPDFIILCKEIMKVRDSDAKNALIGALKANKELYAKLQKDENYKDYWKVFKPILTDLDF